MHSVKVKLSLLAGAALFSLSTWANSPNAWWIDIKNDRSTSVKEAIAKGQDVNAFNKSGHPPIIQAIRDNAIDVYDVLAANPQTNVNIVNINGETPLMYIALVGDVGRAQKLIARGAQVNRLGWTPLHYAASQGHVDMMKMLLANGAFPNAPAAEGSSPIYMAVGSKNKEAVQLLLNAGADARAVNQKGISAFDLAHQMKLSNIIQILN